MRRGVMSRKELGVVAVMTVLGDILQIQHVYTVGDQECRNVFYYEVTQLTGGVTAMIDFLPELNASWLSSLQPVMSTGFTSQRILGENLTDGLELAEYDTNWSGGLPDDPAPALQAIGVKLSRASRLTRNGSKRISGYPESVPVGNTIEVPTNTTDRILQYCRTVFFFPDFNGQGDDIQLTQRIVGRTKNASGKYELDLNKVNPIIDVSIQPNVTSQTSRKVK